MIVMKCIRDTNNVDTTIVRPPAEPCGINVGDEILELFQSSEYPSMKRVKPRSHERKLLKEKHSLLFKLQCSRC